MAGILYLVGTPIGNLNDMSPRALETLKTVDFIAAEDTRVTLKLLNHFSIRKPLLSYYEHNKVESAAVIIPRLLNGESCALVSGAVILSASAASAAFAPSRHRIPAQPSGEMTE